MPARWMGNFHSPVPIRCRGALHFYSARDSDTDKLGVVVTAPRLPRAEARARLSSLVRSHRLVAGEAVPDVLASKVGDAKLVLLFLWSNLEILAGPPRARPSMSATLSQAREMWQLLGIEPDVVGFAAWVADAISIEPERLADAPEDQGVQRIVVGLDAEWVETPNGMRHTLRARRPLRRLLLALMLAHRDRPGGVVGVEELLQAGWPGESPHPEAASNRIHVAISTLRKMGFGEALQRWDGGYRIDPGVQCRFQ